MLNSRLELLIKKLGISKSEFAAIIGFTPSYITMLSNNPDKKPSDSFYKIIRHAFHVRVEWLRDGEGQMLIEDDPELTALERQLVTKYQKLPQSVKHTVDEVVDALLVKHLQALDHDPQKQEK